MPDPSIRPPHRKSADGGLCPGVILGAAPPPPHTIAIFQCLISTAFVHEIYRLPVLPSLPSLSLAHRSLPAVSMLCCCPAHNSTPAHWPWQGPWQGPDVRFAAVPGVIRTRVGYTGGTTPWPTYRRMGNHTETTHIVFDPTVISFRELLVMFWGDHDATLGGSGTQYRSAIFYESESQLEAIAASIEGERAKVQASRSSTQTIHPLPEPTVSSRPSPNTNGSCFWIPDLLATPVRLAPGARASAV